MAPTILRRLLPPLALVFALSAPAGAQIVNAAFGRLVVDDFTDDVAELYLAAPPLPGGIRPNLILSTPLGRVGDDVTVIGQLSCDPWMGIGFDVGAVDTPFDDPTLTVGGHVIQPLWGPLTLTVLHSWQPGPDTQTTVVKLGLTWFRR